jgi:hypothetical protein
MRKISQLPPVNWLLFNPVPTYFKALNEAGVKKLPKSWESSIYQQAAIASARARQRNE